MTPKDLGFYKKRKEKEKKSDLFILNTAYKKMFLNAKGFL